MIDGSIAFPEDETGAGASGHGGIGGIDFKVGGAGGGDAMGQGLVAHRGIDGYDLDVHIGSATDRLESSLRDRSEGLVIRCLDDGPFGLA